MKILLFTRYEDMGASSRVRCLQYLPYLKEHGVEVTVASLLSNDYLRQLYEDKSRSLPQLLHLYLRRLRRLFTIGQYDLVWLEKELFPMLPAFAERFLLRTPYIVDYDDATFHSYDQHSNNLVRSLMGGKIDVVMRRAKLVIAGNEYLAERAKAAGAKRVEIIPTVVDLEKYTYVPVEQGDRPFTIGWIGTPATAKYLHLVQSALAELYGENPNLQIVTIGAGVIDPIGLPVEARTWTEATEVADIQSIDVGIMPLPDNHWERGKCGYKLIQYMACGKPVVASPVGVNREIVQEGVNGFLAASHLEWVAALKKLQADVLLRQGMGATSRKIVAEHYCLQVTAPQIYLLLYSVLQK